MFDRLAHAFPTQNPGTLPFSRSGREGGAFRSLPVATRILDLVVNQDVRPYAQGGYESSFGTYKIEDSHTFTFHVEGALVRTLIGEDLTRVYNFSDRQLIVKSSNLDEHWRVAWEHY